MKGSFAVFYHDYRLDKRYFLLVLEDAAVECLNVSLVPRGTRDVGLQMNKFGGQICKTLCWWWKEILLGFRLWV